MGMIRTIAFLCATLGLSGSAFAADLPPAPPPRAPAIYVPPVLRVYNWSGPVAANDSVKFTEIMIRAGVNFKFNGW